MSFLKPFLSTVSLTYSPINISFLQVVIQCGSVSYHFTDVDTGFFCQPVCGYHSFTQLNGIAGNAEVSPSHFAFHNYFTSYKGRQVAADSKTQSLSAVDDSGIDTYYFPCTVKQWAATSVSPIL